MKYASFTVRKISDYRGRPGTIKAKAASIVLAMEGCRMQDIVDALAAMDHANSPDSNPNPPRWITQFAGLESSASNKAMEPIIEIVADGQKVTDRERFLAAL